MPELFTRIDLSRVRQLRSFKINYRQVRNLEYTDKNRLAPQTFLQYREIIGAILALAPQEQSRPGFPEDLRYLKDYSATQFPKGKVLVWRTMISIHPFRLPLKSTSAIWLMRATTRLHIA